MNMYTEKQLVEFGNLIIKKHCGDPVDGVTHADLENWKESNQRWIKASDQLPPTGVYVTIRDESGDMYTDFASVWDSDVTNYEWLDESELLSPAPVDDVVDAKHGEELLYVLNKGVEQGKKERQPEVDALKEKVEKYEKVLNHVQSVLDESILMAEKLEEENAQLKKRVEELEVLIGEFEKKIVMYQGYTNL